MFKLTWKDKYGCPIEQYEKRPIKSFVRLLFQIIRGNAELKGIKTHYTDRMFASTGADLIGNCKANVRIGVTAHCKCGHVFFDEVVAGINTGRVNIINDSQN